MLGTRRQGYHAGAAAQRGFGTEQCGAAGAEVATDDQHLTKAALMSSWRAGR